jgi:hypothetical protein
VTTKRFWLDTFERAAKTFCQVLAALLVSDGTGLLNSAWGDRCSVAGMAALVSLLTSVASAKVGADDSASLLPADLDPPKGDDGHAAGGGISLAGLLLLIVVLVILF